MRLTKDNINELPKDEQDLVNSLLLDLDYINQKLKAKGHELYVDWQDYHDEYSAERTDPCPDYYGYYRIFTDICDENGYNYQIGLEMTVNDFDNVNCALTDFVEFFI